MDISTIGKFDQQIMNIKEKASLVQREQQTKFAEELDQKINTNDKKPIDQKLMNACIDMESILVKQMLGEMRKTVHKNEMLHGGMAEDFFEDMLYDEYSTSVSKTANFGLAKQIYDQMSQVK